MMLLSGCSKISDTVNNFIENDANIGKNSPVVGTIGDIEAINDAAEKEEEARLTPEEKAERARKEAEKKFNERVNELVSSMTTEEKIGQLLLARIGDEPAENMALYKLGGYTFYADDFKGRTPEDISALTKEIAGCNKIAPFFAVDEEGGSVVRVSKYSAFREEPFSSPQLLYQRGGTELLEIDTEEKARLLLSMGINFNLAPVADISTDESSYIYPRTMGQSPEKTAEAITAIVKTANSKGLASCLKHFPGYGENTDTHKGAAVDNRDLYEFYNRDFVPFEAGINADEDKTPAVMVGHTVYESIDSGTPASLSAKIHNVLRDRLEFDGVIITDDMGMDAIQNYESEDSPYVLAFLAGNDMLCVTDFVTAYTDIENAYNEGRISEKDLNASVKRIIAMKLRYGIIK